MPFGPPEPESAIQAHLARQAAQEESARSLGAGYKYGPAAASLFDALATRDAINRGGDEANPVMAPFAENDAALIGTKLASGLLTGYLANKLAHAGHRNAARVIGGLGIAVPLTAGSLNLAGGR